VLGCEEVLDGDDEGELVDEDVELGRWCVTVEPGAT
jgi:hypothetical protein